MSQENVETARAIFTTWNAGDMDAFSELLDPAVILRLPPRWPEPGPFEGREAVMGEFEQAREIFDFDLVEAISYFVDVGDRVAVRWTWRGQGHGPAASMELSSVYTLRSGRLVEIEFFWDHADALEALGLRE